ncbi:MAG: ribonuclease III [Clostridiales bacterium]|jgi:ribonuclease-3|nr:ribonuclease III [Clostridiales bacterium]
MKELIKKIGYEFKDESLLIRALTHSSYANESGGKFESNERLEFLGDSVLGFITAEFFFAREQDLPEGELTKLRAAAVCEKSLSAFANRIGLGKHLLLGKGEKNSKGNERPSILADAFEALIAAIYLDGGIKPATKFVTAFLEDFSAEYYTINDAKTVLQEIVQKNPGELLEYVLVKESGPDHAKSFEVEVRLNANVIGRGKGKSKKQAEQLAAKEALSLMGL